MKISYLILAHKLPEQLVRLVKKLNCDDVRFFIHVDKKADNRTFKQMVDPLRNMNNVIFTKRTTVKWGQHGHAKATLIALNEMMKSTNDFDYVFLITGQTYPIKSNDHITKYLEGSNGCSYIQYSLPDDKLLTEWAERYENWHFSISKNHFTFPRNESYRHFLPRAINNLVTRYDWLKKKKPGNLKLYYGPAYWCLSKQMTEFVLDRIKNLRELTTFYKYSNHSCESLFQTVILNSPYKEEIVNNDLHYIDFSEHRPNPKILTKSDFGKLTSTGNLFARKFDMSVDAEVLDMIDKIT